MFGSNPLRRQELQTNQLRVEKIFYTIQGEGPLAGHPAVFVRLAGCNLACLWCDTQFETGIDNQLTAEAITQQVLAAFGVGYPRYQPGPRMIEPLVVLTGGEPLRQNIVPLCSALKAQGIHVQIETAGTLWVPGLGELLRPPLAPGVSIVVSPKTGHVVKDIAYGAMAWKYVVSVDDNLDSADGLPNNSPQKAAPHQALARPPKHVLRRDIFVSPCDLYDDAKNKLNRELAAQLAMKYGYRISLQQHKILHLE